MSSTNRPWPVISSASSLRSIGAPIPRSARSSVRAISAHLRSGGGLDRRDDVLIPGAAAEVALEAFADLPLRRVRITLEDGRRGDDHPGRAEAALERVMLVERLLQGMEGAVLGEPLDCRHLVAVGLDGEHGARLDGLAVEQHNAGTAVRRVASDVGAGEAQLVAQEVNEERARLDLTFVVAPVDRDANGLEHGLLLSRKGSSVAVGSYDTAIVRTAALSSRLRRRARSHRAR